MKAKVYIDSDCIGETKFQVADESMGGIVGNLSPNDNYKKYKPIIQSLTKEKGIANASDFNFKILTDETELSPEGGIGITDFDEFDEIIIEAAGNKQEIIEQIKKEASH